MLGRLEGVSCGSSEDRGFCVLDTLAARDCPLLAHDLAFSAGLLTEAAVPGPGLDGLGVGDLQDVKRLDTIIDKDDLARLDDLGDVGIVDIAVLQCQRRTVRSRWSPTRSGCRRPACIWDPW